MTEDERKKIQRFIYKICALNARLNEIDKDLAKLLEEQPDSAEAEQAAGESQVKIALLKNKVAREYGHANDKLG